VTPERWQQIEKVFEAARDYAPEERTTFLERTCTGDEELRREVESLLAHHAQAKSFIESPAADLIPDERQSFEAQLIGHQIGHYQVVRELGRGGMGEVYLAQDTRLHRRVALKILPAEFVKNKARLHCFEQEARAASALNHPNILTIHDIGQTEHGYFIATEFIDGVTLRHRINAGQLELPEILDIAIQVASALSAAHLAGIVHRDIKPENIMLRTDGYVKVLDFGLAKLGEQAKSVTSGEAPTLRMVQTESGVVMGTATYMSPEQARGREVDPRTDIWSLGVVLYEMVVGKTPFAGESMSDVIAAILKTEASPITSVISDAPEELNRIIGKMLRKDREERYQSVKDLAVDMKSLRRALDSHIELGHTSSAKNVASMKLSEQVFATGQMTQNDKLPSGTQAVDLRATSSAEYLISEIRQHKKIVIAILSIIAIGVLASLYGLYKLKGKDQSGVRSPLQITRVSADGKIMDATISPDGNYFGYMLEKGQDCSVWIKHLATNSSVQISSAIKCPILGYALRFSRDGSYVYYSDGSDLYRVPVLGGSVNKIISNVNSAISFSPNGREITFKRLSPDSRSYDVVIANLDSTVERILHTRETPSPVLASGPAWSPDGNLIIYMGEVDQRRQALFAISLADNAERQVGAQTWFEVQNIDWLSDGSGLILAAQSEVGSPTQIWQISYPAAELRRVTNDVNNYVDITQTADSTKLLGLTSDLTSQVWTLSVMDPQSLKQISFGDDREVAWTPDGHIVFSSYDKGAAQLRIMDQSGSNQQALTDGPGYHEHPSISRDGQYIAFALSQDGGRRTVWKMNIDGRNQTQLTNAGSESWPTFSPDGQWIVYESLPQSQASALWKVPPTGGAPSKVSDETGVARVSPDNKLIASTYYDFKTRKEYFQVRSFENGERVGLFELALGNPIPPSWLPDASGICFVETRGSISNIWVQPLQGGPRKQITDFKSDYISSFDLSQDGKRLAIARGPLNTQVVLITNFR